MVVNQQEETQTVAADWVGRFSDGVCVVKFTDVPGIGEVIFEGGRIRH